MKITITNEELIAQYHAESCPVKKEWLREDFFALNRRFAYHIAKKHKHDMIDEEDLAALALVGMAIAFDTFKPEKKIKFVTYAGTCMRNEILMFFRRKGRYWQHTSLNKRISDDAEDADTERLDLIGDPDTNVEETVIDNRTMVEIKDMAKTVLNPKEYIVFENMLDEKGKSQSEMAQLLNLSQSYVSRIEKIVVRKLKGHLGLLTNTWEVIMA